jgi:heptaprenyl diphosphate synthase
VAYLHRVVALNMLLDLPNLGSDLKRVETALTRSIQSEDPFLTQVAGHLLSAGGKRLRPALALAAGHLASNPAHDDVVEGAASVELVHLGSLYHDDVMDEAQTRRTVESVNARWGNLVAILAGDFLLARASEVAASLGTEVSALLAATIGSLCEGQVRELQHAFDVKRSEDAYLRAIEGKTAALMSASCRIGALAAGLPVEQVDSLTVYGQRIGMAFQIVDDVLDLVATDDQLGKPAGNDLVEGIYTLPVIRAMETEPAATELRALLGRRLQHEEVERARLLVRSNGAVTSACGLARDYAVEASEALKPLGEGPVVSALAAVGHHLVDNLPV